MSVAVAKRKTMCIICKGGMKVGSLKMVIRSGSVHMRCWKQRGVQSPTSFDGFRDLDEEKREEFLSWINKWKEGNIVHVDKKRKRAESESSEDDGDERVTKKSKPDTPCAELPKDAWSEIIQVCDVISLVALSHVNKTLKQVTEKDEMWKNAAEDAFPNAPMLKKKLKLSWKQLCIQGVYNGATKQSKTGPCGNCGQHAFWDPLFKLFVCHKCDGNAPFTFVGETTAKARYGVTSDELETIPARKKKLRTTGLDWYDTRSYAVMTYPELLLARFVKAKEKAKANQKDASSTTKSRARAKPKAA